MTELTITPTVRDGVQVLVVEGEVDVSSVEVLEAALAGRRHGLPAVADLSLLTFIDSSGLHALCKAAEAGRLAAIVRVANSNLSRVLKIVDLDQVVRVFDDLPAATRHAREHAA